MPFSQFLLNVLWKSERVFLTETDAREPSLSRFRPFPKFFDALTEFRRIVPFYLSIITCPVFLSK